MEASTILLGLAALGAAGAALVGGDRPANAATPAAGGAAPPAAGGASSTTTTTTTPAAPPASGTTPPPPNPYGPGGGVAPPPPPPPPPPSSTSTTGSSQPIGGTYTPPGGGAAQPVAPGDTAGASGAASSTSTTGDARYPRQDPRRLPSGITSAKIRFAQGVLRGLNFNVSADGAWGPRTSDAILAFQGAANRDHASWRLTVDGVLGPRTLAALGWYFDNTRIGYLDDWNRLASGLSYNQATVIASDASEAGGLQGLGDIGPARW